jgi:hypothetical protein
LVGCTFLSSSSSSVWHLGVAAIMQCRPTNIFIYNLARNDLKMKTIEKIFFFLNSTSLLKLFSLLYHLISVVSLLSTQRRRKSNDWLARNQYVFTLRDMSTTTARNDVAVWWLYTNPAQHVGLVKSGSIIRTNYQMQCIFQCLLYVFIM